MNATAAPANHDPLAHLWATARALLAQMITMFGAPNALIAHARLERTLRRALMPYVRSLEELVRKLLLAEAAEQIPSTAPPPRRPLVLAPFTRIHAAEEIADRSPPHARFNLTLPRDERMAPESRAPRIRALWGETTPPKAPRQPPPFARAPPRTDRLALRFSALRNVIEKPAAYIRRLALRLACLARDLRARSALRFVCRGADRIAPGFGDALRDAGRLAIARAQKLSNSS
ncbi:MAG: hypothetical protein QM759_06505 [Terricaulis sp.]